MEIKIDKKIIGVALKATPKFEEEVVKITDVKLPSDAPARVKTLKSEGKKWYLTVVMHEDTGHPFALFVMTNHSEQTFQTSNAMTKLEALARKKGILSDHVDSTMEKCKRASNINKLARIISLLLRHEVHIKNIVSTLDTIEDISVGSFLFQIKKYLSGYIQDGEAVEGKVCSSCGGDIVYSGGCATCLSCGDSVCG